jgi:anti-anti-sigma factor
MPMVNRVELSGEYDLSRRDEIAALFGSLRPEGPAVVDMSQVTYVDSTFLHELATLHFRFQELPVTLVGVNDAIKRILRIVRFDKLFSISDS